MVELYQGQVLAHSPAFITTRFTSDRRISGRSLEAGALLHRAAAVAAR